MEPEVNTCRLDLRETESYLLFCRFVPYAGWATIIMTAREAYYQRLFKVLH
jgi:hypothetical protein